jgi:hypothetical protein
VLFETERRATGSDASDWAESALVQKVRLAQCPILNVSFGAWPQYRTAADGRSPLLAPGLQVFDDEHTGKVVWMMLAKNAYRDTLPNRTTAIWQTPVSADARALFDLEAAIAWLGSPPAQEANLKLALAVHKDVREPQRMEVKSVSCSTRG